MPDSDRSSSASPDSASSSSEPPAWARQLHRNRQRWISHREPSWSQCDRIRLPERGRFPVGAQTDRSEHDERTADAATVLRALVRRDPAGEHMQTHVAAKPGALQRTPLAREQRMLHAATDVIDAALPRPASALRATAAGSPPPAETNGTSRRCEFGPGSVTTSAPSTRY